MALSLRVCAHSRQKSLKRFGASAVQAAVPINLITG
jgi:hypothetical protein